MNAVKLNHRVVENKETGTLELQGTAKVARFDSEVRSYTNGKGEEKNYRLADVSFINADGGVEVHSAQVSEKVYSKEGGVKADDLVSINISKANGTTYFRVIGVGGGSGLQSDDLFNSLFATAKQAKKATTPATESAPEMAGDK